MKIKVIITDRYHAVSSVDVLFSRDGLPATI